MVLVMEASLVAEEAEISAADCPMPAAVAVNKREVEGRGREAEVGSEN